MRNVNKSRVAKRHFVPRELTNPSKREKKNKKRSVLEVEREQKLQKNNNKFDSIYLSFFPVILHLTFKSNNKTKRYYRKQAKLFICTNKVKKVCNKVKAKTKTTYRHID